MSEDIQLHPAVYIDVIPYPKDNTFVAECLELPIVVEAETLEKVQERMNLAIKGFIQTFPEECKIALSQTKIKISTKQLDESTPAPEKTVLKIPIPQTY